MQNLEIQEEVGTFLRPTVLFSAETGICKISGESYLENTFEFYKQLADWLERYTREVNKPLTMDIRLTYFNTSSSKGLVNLLKILKNYQENGGEIKVDWHYKRWDEDMLDEIEDMSIDADLQINVIPEDE